MTCPAPFETRSNCPSTDARTGTLRLRRAEVSTPIFMPVGTQGAIRGMPPHFLADVGAQIILANTYHLNQRPGEALIEKLGGLHKFMAVDLPILTDSGGFQVFSLRKKEISEEGVTFSYEVDGKKTFLSPERSMQIQQKLGSDIAMAFDECLPPEADRAATEKSVDMTARWAERCIKAHEKPEQSLFGIVQGGMHGDLRRRSAQQITSLPFDGFAVGGLSVGEGPDLMNAILAETMPHMPKGTARYLMGVGRPQDLVDGVALGIDMFDCVIPTRHARSGTLYTFQGRIRITHARYRRDSYPIDTSCDCYTCKHFSRAYLHHLFEIGEILGAMLATIHNLSFFGHLMARIRATIEDGTFASFRNDIHALYPEKNEEREVDEDEHKGALERMAAPRSWAHEPAVVPARPARQQAAGGVEPVKPVVKHQASQPGQPPQGNTANKARPPVAAGQQPRGGQGAARSTASKAPAPAAKAPPKSFGGGPAKGAPPQAGGPKTRHHPGPRKTGR